MPGLTFVVVPVVTLVTAVGPAALSFQSVFCAVPPLSLTTIFFNVSVACWAVFVIVHVTSSPLAGVTVPFVALQVAAPVQDHCEGVYPFGPADSPRV